MAVGDKDLMLKLRTKRIFSSLGYYTPLEIELSQYFINEKGSTERKSLTDIDVLAIKFDHLFHPDKVIADCKSGSTSESNRLFWLKGVADYFGVQTAYIIKSKINPHTRAIAPKLNLRSLSEPELTNLENSLNIKNFKLPIADLDYYKKIESLWGIKVDEQVGITPEQQELKRVYSYLSYEFWFIDTNRNLYQLVNNFNKIAHILDSTKPEHVLLAYNGLQRFTYCILELCHQLYMRGISDIDRNAKLYFNGGPIALKDKEKLFELFNKLTASNEHLHPPFLPDILEFAHRMIKNPNSAIKILPYVDTIYCWCEQLGNTEINSIYGDELNTGCIVLAIDSVKTFCNSTGLDQKIFKSILSL